MASQEEFVLGYVPHRDGSDYDEDAPTPTWEDVLGVIDDNNMGSADIIVYGKIYKNSDAIGSGAYHMHDTDEAFLAPENVTPDEPNVPGSGSFKRSNTKAYIEDLMGWEEGSVQHIVGIVIRKLG